MPICMQLVQRSSLVDGGCVGFDVCGEAVKGARWMPWHQEPKKDVATCDKPRGVGKRTVIRGCPNGETPLHVMCSDPRLNI